MQHTSEFKYPFLKLSDVNRAMLDDLKEAACRVIDSGRYIAGEEVEAFESELADFCRAPYTVAVSNGHDALRLILTAWQEMGLLQRGDGVVVPANTCIASFLAISNAGLRPVAVDPDPRTFNLCAESIERACHREHRVKAVMPVHLYGRIAWDTDIRDVATRNGLLIIEDSAQAIGATASCNGLFASRHAGAIGHAGAISFYPTKNTGALGDAGAVVTHSETLANTVRALANYGLDRPYHNVAIGSNCRMDSIQAAMLRVKLAHTRQVNARRFERAVAYNNVISNPCVIKPEITPAVIDQTWHQYVVRITAGLRHEMRSFLARNGVETAVHYPIPPHLQPCYAHLMHEPLPVTERLADEIISLPIADGTSVADAAAIGRIINSFPYAK